MLCIDVENYKYDTGRRKCEQIPPHIETNSAAVQVHPLVENPAMIQVDHSRSDKQHVCKTVGKREQNETEGRAV
jgi:hypothetical protein